MVLKFSVSFIRFNINCKILSGCCVGNELFFTYYCRSVCSARTSWQGPLIFCIQIRRTSSKCSITAINSFLQGRLLGKLQRLGLGQPGILDQEETASTSDYLTLANDHVFNTSIKKILVVI